MKSLVLVTVFTVFLTLAPRATAQGLRGAATGRGNSLGSAQSGTITSQTRQGGASTTTITTTTAPGGALAPKAQIRSTPTATPQLFVPPVFHGGRVPLVQPNTLRQAPTVVIETGRSPRHPHRPHRPHRAHWPIIYPYPGIVIFETPYYSSNTVITEMAPGVVREERRVTEPDESRTRSSGQLAPFDPTPQEVVDRMLRLAAVKPGDVLYDLGAGDGRVVIAAAKKFAVKAVGFEIDPGLVKLARENVRKQGVEHLVEIRQQDFLTADLSLPSVVTLYLSYDGNLTVRPRLMSQLKTGARVVSYTFDMAEWQPKVAENYRDVAGNNHMIYLWEIGGPLAFSDGRQ
ncbi:MAG: SAM-dependent methyltransferase [Candidatus Binatia bacterium]